MAHTAPVLSDHVVIGVDTHKHIHVSAVMDSLGRLLDTLTIPTDTSGFTQLLTWAQKHGKIMSFGIEGTGSYGAGLASFLRRKGYQVIEVCRPDRRLRRMNGKSDSLDAQHAAKAVLAGSATATPKSADGSVEMIRQLKVAHDTAVKQRSSTMITLKAMIVHSCENRRREAAGKSPKALAKYCASLRPRSLACPQDANTHALRSLARRWLALNDEITELEDMIKTLVTHHAPELVNQFGIGIDTAAEILIVVGDNPQRIKSEAALAKLAGISPIPTGSGTTSGKHRINHGGHRQLNAAIYRTVIVRMRFHEPTIAYVKRRTAEGKSKRDIIRCLKRYVIREVYHLIKTPPQATPKQLDNYRSINALAESVNDLYKAELIHAHTWESLAEVEWETLCWVHWWNTTRLHSELGYHTPQKTEDHYWHTHSANTPNLRVTA